MSFPHIAISPPLPASCPKAQENPSHVNQTSNVCTCYYRCSKLASTSSSNYPSSCLPRRRLDLPTTTMVPHTFLSFLLFITAVPLFISPLHQHFLPLAAAFASPIAPRAAANNIQCVNSPNWVTRRFLAYDCFTAILHFNEKEVVRYGFSFVFSPPLFFLLALALWCLCVCVY